MAWSMEDEHKKLQNPMKAHKRSSKSNFKSSKLKPMLLNLS
jgi:hypothetical protein